MTPHSLRKLQSSTSTGIGGCLLPPPAICCTVAALLLAPPVRAQEALRNSLAGDAAAEARHVQSGSQPYTVKAGDFRLLAVPSVGLDWNDNIDISRSNSEQDFILRPTLQLDASYPLTQWNLLRLNVGAGYDKYLEHDEYSTWRLNAGTQLSFDIYIKNLWINLHDRVQYVQDAARQPTLANTADFATINNTAGLLATWDLEDLTPSLGYDHENVFSETTRYQSQDRSTESVVGRTGFRLGPGTTVGVEATAAFTTYAERVLNNNNGYSVGVYGDWRPGSYFQIQPRAGYAIYQFQHSSSFIQTGDVSSWYADLNIAHQITDSISYSLDGGHEISLGILSDATEDWYVRPAVRWNVIRNGNLHASLSYELGKQGAGNIRGNLTENYDWLALGLGFSCQILRKLSASVNYRMTLRSSDHASRDYTQNIVGIQFAYVP